MTTVKIRTDLLHHLFLVMGPSPTYDIAFDILIQYLVRIQIRTVTRKIKNLDALFVLRQPLLHPRGHMDRMLVNNQNDILRNLAYQSFQKFQKDFCSEPVFKNHKIQASAIGKRRDHVTPKPLSCPRNHRRLPSTSIRPTTRMIRSQSHLISPINLRFHQLGQLPNLRILLLQPPTDLFRVLLKGFPNRLLRRKPPPSQIPPHRPSRKTNTKLPLYQLPHRLPSPKKKGELQLFRIPMNHRFGNLSRLPRQKRRFRGPASLSSTKCTDSPFPIFLDPLPYGLTSDSKDLRGFDLCLPFQNRLDDLQTKIFLGKGWKGAGISYLHALYISSFDINCNLFYAPSNKSNILKSPFVPSSNKSSKTSSPIASLKSSCPLPNRPSLISWANTGKELAARNWRPSS